MATGASRDERGGGIGVVAKRRVRHTLLIGQAGQVWPHTSCELTFNGGADTRGRWQGSGGVGVAWPSD